MKKRIVIYYEKFITYNYNIFEIGKKKKIYIIIIHVIEKAYVKNTIEK
jgi:hypothetical protein